MEGKAHFVSPEIQDNPDGWGPCSVPTAFKDIPYQPFSKGDRIGKVTAIIVKVKFDFLRSLQMAHGHVPANTGFNDFDLKYSEE